MTHLPDARSIADGVAEHRAVRRGIEDAIPPLGLSESGTRFAFQAPLRMDGIDVGAYLVLEPEDGRTLVGLVIEQQVVRQAGPELETNIAGIASAQLELRARRGSGVLLAELRDGAVLPPPDDAFVDAHLRVAERDELEALSRHGQEHGARLAVAHTRQLDVPFALRAAGFNRHTFLCGQSGSGKTYSLGVLLEQLLLHTTLPVVVLDPNGDYTRLAEVSSGVDDAAASAWAAVASGIRVARTGGEVDLRVRLDDLSPAGQAAVLGLDPIADREEYAAFHEAVDELPADAGLDELLALLEAGSEAGRALALRLANLGIERLGVWAGIGDPSITDLLVAEQPRCLVVDLGSLDTAFERTIVAEAVLGTLWRERARREPVLVVVDEAHNVCPAAPADRLSAVSAATCALIAGEGRKFGLHLLLATQRPQKLDENVVSQCENLVLLRMVSAADLARLQEIFSFVPPTLVSLALGFRQGDALIAGGIVDHPRVARIGGRLTEEGGADVPTKWALP